MECRNDNNSLFFAKAIFEKEGEISSCARNT